MAGTKAPWRIVDGHEDIAMALLEQPERDFAAPAPAGQALSLPAAEAAGVALLVATLFSPEGYYPHQTPVEGMHAQLRCYDELIAAHPDRLFRIQDAAGLSRIRAGGPIGLLHLMEGADGILSVDELPTWAARGVRAISPAWNTPNRWCGGIRDPLGLTPDGKELVRGFAPAGILPDLSHLSPHAIDEVFDLHPGLLVASHSNARALRDHPRNLDDERAAEVGRRGGVIGVVLYGPFLSEAPPTLEHVVAHIEHLAEVAGPAHVGLGTDLDGGFSTDEVPEALRSQADLPIVGRALLARGWSEADVAGVMGENWLRVLGTLFEEEDPGA